MILASFCYDDRALDVRRAPAVLEGVGASWQGVEADCDPHPDPHRCSDSVSEWVRVGTLFFCFARLFLLFLDSLGHRMYRWVRCGARCGAMCRPVGWAKMLVCWY